MDNHPNSSNYIVSFNRYKFAGRFVKNKDVLDLSCGIGYGSKHLAKFAKKVVGADVDKELIDYCKSNIKKKNVEFVLIDADGKVNKSLIKKFDVVVSLETVEHAKDYKLFLKNLKSYLKDNGTIILSTPNNFKKIYPPENKFHIYEFDIIEFYKILRKIFPEFEIELFGQRKTTIKRRDEIFKDKLTIRTLIFKILNYVWVIDFKYFQLFNKIENFNFYKKMGSLQRNGNNDFSIYKIDSKNNFENPITSVYLIYKK